VSFLRSHLVLSDMKEMVSLIGVSKQQLGGFQRDGGGYDLVCHFFNGNEIQWCQ
jgi:hypothetical protein